MLKGEEITENGEVRKLEPPPSEEEIKEEMKRMFGEVALEAGQSKPRR